MITKGSHLKPDFWGIGGTRCGSTWLHAQLSKHPHVWLPPIKELHYFDRSPHYHSPSYLSDAGLIRFLISLDSQQRARRRRLARALAASIAKFRVDDAFWNSKYFLGPSTDDWYRSLFPDDASLACGDITPAYSILDEEDVARAYAVNPDAKVIFIMRDPVERSWSSSKDVSTLSEAEHLERVLSFNHQVRSDYVRTLKIWEKQFPAEQIYIAFFDDIVGRPAWLLDEVCGFLGIDPPSESLRESLKARVNATPESVEMPLPVRQALAHSMLPSLRVLADRFGGHPKHWLEKAEDCLLETDK